MNGFFLTTSAPTGIRFLLELSDVDGTFRDATSALKSSIGVNRMLSSAVVNDGKLAVKTEE